jgi:hypothetical protein
LASIGTVVSSAAVLISVAYLGLQLRQNVRHTRALIHQGRVSLIVDLQMKYAEPTMAAAILKGNGEEPTPDAVQRMQFDLYCWSMLMSMEDTFAQHSDGLLSDVQFDGLRRGLRGAVSEPGVRTRWQYVLASDRSNFATYVREMIAGLPADAPEAGTGG